MKLRIYSTIVFFVMAIVCCLFFTDESAGEYVKLASDLPTGAEEEIRSLNVLDMSETKIGVEDIVAESGRTYRKWEGHVFYNSQGREGNIWGRIDEVGMYYLWANAKFEKAIDNFKLRGGCGVVVSESGRLFDLTGKQLVPSRKGEGDGWYKIPRCPGDKVALQRLAIFRYQPKTKKMKIKILD